MNYETSGNKTFGNKTFGNKTFTLFPTPDYPLSSTRVSPKPRLPDGQV